MNQGLKLIVIIVACLVLFSCEKESYEQDLGGIESSTNANLSSLMMMCNIEGCPVYLNGGMEIGSGNFQAFSNGSVNLWSAAYGSADRIIGFQGISPFEGSFMARMLRYKSNPNYYEAIVSDVLLKERNNYCLSYQSRGNNLEMGVYAAQVPIMNDLGDIIPSYNNDLGGGNFPNIVTSTNNQDDWKYSQISFSDKTGNLLFVPNSVSANNPSQMLLDDVELICEYGYLDGITNQIISSTITGYDYKFFAQLGEPNSNLSYLWNISYGNTGYSSTAESPVFNLPYPGKDVYEVTICLNIRDIDGCCTELCETFVIGEVIEEQEKLCNYTLCMDDFKENFCGDGDVFIQNSLGEWTCITCDDDPIDVLTDIINGFMDLWGFDPIDTKIVESSKTDCTRTFIIECWENPINSIAYICDYKALGKDMDTRSIPSFQFVQDCDVDCEK